MASSEPERLRRGVDMSRWINGLVEAAIEADLIQSRDRTYARNRLLDLLNETPADEVASGSIVHLLDRLIDGAVETGMIEDFVAEREILGARLMDVFVPSPSVIEQVFYQKYNEDKQAATNYFYTLSENSNYIQTERIKKNISYKVETAYGAIDMTINMSKPEKDPKEIARQKQSGASGAGYPTCLLCVENEGYAGRLDHPARTNHRIVPLELGGENWYLQYSPYVYYNEHCILLSEEHRDMVIDRGTFTRLLDFVGKFPHYFAGSNADLPIVGGSILSHDHYQGGQYTFTMADAKERETFVFEEYPSITGASLQWPLSVIRLKGKVQADLVACATHILETWRGYSDQENDILAETDAPHNTVTPIARMRDEVYELDLVLRNNRTTDEHPLGIFHPHADIHHIKRENIGLIEVMGLAVLPARLKEELEAVISFVETGSATVVPMHQAWAEELRDRYDGKEDARAFVYEAVGHKFVRGLEDCGVFKLTATGDAGLRRFIKVCQPAQETAQ